MRKVVILTIILICIGCPYTLQAKRYRTTDRQKKELTERGDRSISTIEDCLNANEALLKQNTYIEKLKDPTKAIQVAQDRLQDSKYKEYIKKICLECYMQEYKLQKQARLKINHRVKNTDGEDSQSAKTTTKTEPGIKSPNAPGYKNLAQELDKYSKTTGQLAVFCDLDVNFSIQRFSLFMKSHLKMTSNRADIKFTPSFLGIKFIPADPANPDDIVVKYDLLSTSKHQGISSKEAPKVSVVKKVEIIGSGEIISNIFLTYWGHAKSGEAKKNEMGCYIFMGDRIALVPENPTIYKIIITPSNYDYHSAFGVE